MFNEEVPDGCKFVIIDSCVPCRLVIKPQDSHQEPEACDRHGGCVHRPAMLLTPQVLSGYTVITVDSPDYEEAYEGLFVGLPGFCAL